MSRVFITGSSDGLGLMAGRLLAAEGHSVVLHARNVVLALAVARRWPAVPSNAVEPGWVPTKMGGPGAPDDMALAPVTQAWLAVSDDAAATGTGGYFYHQRPRATHPAAGDVKVQEELLGYCADIAGTELP